MNGISGLDAAWTLVPVVVLAVTVVGTVLVIALLLWILYTIIWKGVLRGLEEYYGPGGYRGFSPAPIDEAPAQATTRDRRHGSGRLTR